MESIPPEFILKMSHKSIISVISVYFAKDLFLDSTMNLEKVIKEKVIF